MNYNDITGLYTCPFCGTISSIDYGASCGCLYDNHQSKSEETDYFSLVDWMPVEGKNFTFGYSDDSEIVNAICTKYGAKSNGSDFVTFFKDNKEYRLYF